MNYRLLALPVVALVLVGAGCAEPVMYDATLAESTAQDTLDQLDRMPKSLAISMRDARGEDTAFSDALLAEFEAMKTTNGFKSPMNITVSSVEDGVDSEEDIPGAQSFSKIKGTFTCGAKGAPTNYEIELAYTTDWDMWVWSDVSVESCK